MRGRPEIPICGCAIKLAAAELFATRSCITTVFRKRRHQQEQSMSSVVHRVVVAAVAAPAMAFAGAAHAQGVDFSKVVIKTIDLGHNTYRLEGQGGNITVAVGTDGIIMVDGQFAPLHD